MSWDLRALVFDEEKEEEEHDDEDEDDEHKKASNVSACFIDAFRDTDCAGLHGNTFRTEWTGMLFEKGSLGRKF